MTTRVKFQGHNFDRKVVKAFVRSVRELCAARVWEVMDATEPLVVDVPAVGLESLVYGVRKDDVLNLVLSYMIARRSTGAEGREDRRLRELRVRFVSRATDAQEFERVRRTSALVVGDKEVVAWVSAVDHSGRESSFDERHLWLLARCGSALADLCVRMPRELGVQRGGQLCESFTDEDGIEVLLSNLPGSEPSSGDVGRSERDDAAQRRSMFEVTELRAGLDEELGCPSVRFERHVRNEACPCGSGRTYKKCCLAQDRREATRARRDTNVDTDDDTGDEAGDFNGHMIGLLVQFAEDELQLDWSRAEKILRTSLTSGSLVVPWALYCHRVEGRSPARHFEERLEAQLSARERAWLTGRLDGWMSIFEVDAVDPGVAIDFIDLLTGRRVRVRERTASKLLRRRDALLARIVEEGGHFVLDGVHEFALPPDLTGDLVRRAKVRLRSSGDVEVERLDDPNFTAYLSQRWAEAVRKHEARHRLPPRLSNTDGDVLVATCDHFTFAAKARDLVVERLAALEDARREEDGDDGDDGDNNEEIVVTFRRPSNFQHTDWKVTIIGRAYVQRDALMLETNSIERADALKARVMAVLADTLHGADRSTTDFAEHLAPSHATAHAQLETEELTSLAEQHIVRDHLEKHYTNWPDMKLPALGDRTPREAMKSAAGRAAVENLVKTMEHHDSSQVEWKRYDFDRLRKALGLPT